MQLLFLKLLNFKPTILNKIIRNKDVLIKNGAKKSVLLYYLSDQKIYKEWERDGLLTFKKPGVPDIDSPVPPSPASLRPHFPCPGVPFPEPNSAAPLPGYVTFSLASV